MSKQLQAARYERKYLIPTEQVDLKLLQLEKIIKRHPAGFKQIYEPRRVNNLYFDTRSLTSYNDNVNGVSQRFKVRLRWYTQEQLQSATKAQPLQLEFKLKQAQVVSKQIFAFENVELNLAKIKPSLTNYIRQVETDQSLLTNSLLIKAGLYQPSLVNSYQRQYFLSANKQVRLTIDWQVEFFALKSLNEEKDRFFVVKRDQKQVLPGIILEIKADLSADQQVREMAKFFPFNLTRSSKYVMGLQMV